MKLRTIGQFFTAYDSLHLCRRHYRTYCRFQNWLDVGNARRWRSLVKTHLCFPAHV